MHFSKIKRICTFASLYLGLSASHTIYATTFDCGNISIPDRIEKEGDNYVFNVKQNCIIKNSSSMDMEKLKRVFPEALAYDQTSRVMKVYEDSNHGREKAVRVDIEQKKKSPHGDMLIRADLYLSYDENNGTYKSFYETRRIQGSGNAENTKEINDTIVVTPQKNALHMSLTRVVKITKPWYAPKNIFFSKAKEGLKEDFHEVTDMQKSIFNAM